MCIAQLQQPAAPRCCSFRTRSGLLPLCRFYGIILVLSVAIGCSGERIYEKLQWSSELCAALGYESEFDVCGVIEFCTGSSSSGGGGGNGQRRQRKRHLKQRTAASERQQQRHLRRHKSDHDFHAAKKNIISCDSGDGKSKSSAHMRSKYYATHKMTQHQQQQQKQHAGANTNNATMGSENDSKSSSTQLAQSASMEMHDTSTMEMEDMEGMDMEDMDMGDSNNDQSATGHNSTVVTEPKNQNGAAEKGDEAKSIEVANRNNNTTDEESSDEGEDSDKSMTTANTTTEDAVIDDVAETEEEHDGDVTEEDHDEQEDEDGEQDQEGNEEQKEEQAEEGEAEPEGNWTKTDNEVFSEEVEEEKEKYEEEHEEDPASDSSTTTNTTKKSYNSNKDFDLESWLATNLPVLALDDPINQAEFGWRLPGSSHCSWPGPQIRVQPGVQHGLLVKGAPGIKTNLHFHGLHTAEHGNGDNMMRVVNGDDGDVLVYALNVPDHHMGGTHWYHSQLHGEMQRQVGGGAFGMLIVEDDTTNVGTTDPNVKQFLKREVMLVVDNRKEAHHWTANGLDKEHFRLQRNEWYRMRILAVNTDSYSVGETLAFGGDACKVHALAHDGIFRFQVPEATARLEFSLTTASRLDVAIHCQDESSISIGSQLVASIAVFDPEESTDTTSASPFESGDQVWNSTRPPYLADLRDLPVDNKWKVHMDEVDINHQSWFMQRPLCDDKDQDFVYDSIQEWSITGLESHPLHVHMYPMQVVSEDGCGSGHAVGEFYDTLSAHGNMEVSRNCKVRLRLTDVAGPTVVQSQTLQHCDQGSIGIFHVVGGPEQAQDPHFFRCNDPENCDQPESIITCSEW